MKTIRLLGMLAVFLFAAETAMAATLFVRAGATGANNGTDWTNAYTSLPSTLTRGNTYYLAGGGYGSHSFNDSGTLVITIKKATIVDHGTNTGWSDTYASTQAVFGGWSFSAGNYDIDGQTGGGPDNWTNNLGIKNAGITARSGTSISNLIFRHIDIDGGATSSNGSRPMDIGDINGITLQYCYVHNAGDDVITAIRISNFLAEYSKFSTAYESATYHPDVMQGYGGPYSNIIWRYNYIYDVDVTYLWGVHDGNTATTYEIYGNFIVFTSRSNTTDGIVGDLNGNGTINNLKFYNNTITGDFNYNIGFGTGSIGIVGSNNAAYNNLWVRLTGSGYNGSISSVTRGSNSAYNATVGGVTDSGSGNPFVNSSAENYKLTGPTAAGSSFASPYNVDMYGNVRGADGVWDRGAIEFNAAGGGGLARPSAPFNLSIN